MPGFSRQNLADIYRPQGPKPIALGLPILTTAASGGGQINLTQAVDLSLPIRGIRLVVKGRVVIGTAAMTSVVPEGLLNLISNVFIQGTNARQQGNLTLWNIDFASAFVIQHLFAYRNGLFTIGNVGTQPDTLALPPTQPFPPGSTTTQGYFNTPTLAPGAVGTYDFRMVCDFPFHPHENNANGKEPLTVVQYLVRNEEWKDSIQIQITGGTQAGNSTGVLGVAAATTTLTYTAFGSGSGTPTVDVYSLPVLMGLTLKDGILPGVISRVATPITSSLLTSAGTNVALANMQKQPTPRIIFKNGTGTVGTSFASLLDTNVTTLGVLLGGNRNVRNKLDVWAHKMQHADVYDRDPVQGYVMMDFIDQGNPDSAYPGQDIGDGATFQLIGDVAGTGSALGLVVQEQILHQPTGQLLPA
jgi:hypothetical protein